VLAPAPSKQGTRVSASVTQERLAAQLLAGSPARDPVAVTRRLLAVQGQDPRGARLAIRARSRGLTAAAVDRALSEQRSLLITWLNRGTLHLVCSEDYSWLHALTTPPLLTGNARRLAQEGVSPSAAERGMQAIERALAAEGPLTRAQLRERIAAARVKTDGQALVHLLMLATLRGSTVRGPMAGREHAYVLVRDWLGEPRPVERDVALAELARRYLAGHAPANARDLARWAGLALRDARAGLAAIAPQLRERPDGLLEPAKRRRAVPEPPPRLLGAFDPLLLGWCSREEIVGANKSLVTNNGLFRPFALVRGKAVASWRLIEGEVAIEPFGRLAREDRAALEEDARDVVRYLAPPMPSAPPTPPRRRRSSS
jgi:Winged helix DNA-binding domain